MPKAEKNPKQAKPVTKAPAKNGDKPQREKETDLDLAIQAMIDEGQSPSVNNVMRVLETAMEDQEELLNELLALRGWSENIDSSLLNLKREFEANKAIPF